MVIRCRLCDSIQLRRNTLDEDEYVEMECMECGEIRMVMVVR